MQGFLNHTLAARDIIVRPAWLSDRAAIGYLTENSHRIHFNLDWWSFDQWLHSDRPSEAIWLAFDRQDLIGLWAAPFEQSPVVWLRALAMANGYSADPIFTALFNQARSALHGRGAEQVTILAHPQWVNDLTQRQGFNLYNRIITLRKNDREIPDLQHPPAAVIRPARAEDIAVITENDRASFDTIWWHSAASLEYILKVVAHFVVAECGDQVVGHAFSDVYGGHGHLIRLVVHPHYQRRGIGEQLLKESLHFQLQVGAYPLTLNTQLDNTTSQALYRRYGYLPTGQPVQVMQCTLS
jgi:ribosomal-protein-alanine N-acetyltransferase